MKFTRANATRRMVQYWCKLRFQVKLETKTVEMESATRFLLQNGERPPKHRHTQHTLILVISLISPTNTLFSIQPDGCVQHKHVCVCECVCVCARLCV